MRWYLRRLLGWWSWAGSYWVWMSVWMRLGLYGLEVCGLGKQVAGWLRVIWIYRLPRSDLSWCKSECSGTGVLWLLEKLLHVFDIWHTELAAAFHIRLLPTSKDSLLVWLKVPCSAFSFSCVGQTLIGVHQL